jgi:TolB-like protein
MLSTRQILQTASIPALVLLLIFVNTNLAAKQEKVYPRRVLLIDFADQNKNGQTTYLDKSLPEAFGEQLKKTGNFTILNQQSVERYAKTMSISMKDLLDEKNAIRLGKAIGADVVVVGTYDTTGGEISFHVKMVDVHAGKTDHFTGDKVKMDAALFASVDTLAQETSKTMAAKMKPYDTPPPEAEVVLVNEKGSLIAISNDTTLASKPIVIGSGKATPPSNSSTIFDRSLFASASVIIPISSVATYVNSGPGFTLGFSIRPPFKWAPPQLVAIAEISGAINGGNNLSGIYGVGALAGIGYELMPVKSWGVAVLPNVLAGMSYGRAAGDAYLEAEIKSGVIFARKFGNNLFFLADINAYTLLDNVLSSWFLNFGLGAGYHF